MSNIAVQSQGTLADFFFFFFFNFKAPNANMPGNCLLCNSNKNTYVYLKIFVSVDSRQRHRSKA